MKRLCTLLTLKNRSINIYATCVKSYIADDQISHIINQIPDLYIWGFCQHFKMKQGGNRMIKTLLGQVGEYKKEANAFAKIVATKVTATKTTGTGTVELPAAKQLRSVYTRKIS